MNERQETYEREISITELLLYCLKKWRWILLMMLIMAAAAGSYKYLSTVKSNQAKQEQILLEKNKTEQKEEEVIANPNVKYYELAIEKSEQELKQQEEYLKDSVLMQLDAYHLPTGTLSFYLDGLQEENKLDSLLAAYRAYVTDGRLASELAAADDGISVSEMQYLLAFINGERDSYLLNSNLIIRPEQNVFQIRITAPSEELCKEYLRIADGGILEYSSYLKEEIGEHKLQLLTTTQSERVDKSIDDYQTGILNSYTAAIRNLQSLRTELETVLSNEGETIVVNEPIVLENPVSSAVKFAVLGLVLGAFLAGFVLILIYLTSGRLLSTTAFKEEFGMPLLGLITKHQEKQRLFGFVDRWISRIEEGAYADISYEEQLKIIASNLKAAAAKEEGLKKIMLAGTIAEKEIGAFCGQIAEEVKELQFSPYERIVFQASALEELGGYDGILFLEKLGASGTKLIKKERELVSDRNVRILGTVVL